MKKIILSLFISLLTINVAYAEISKETYETVQSLINLMESLSKSDEYIKQAVSGENIIVNEISKLDFSKPSAIYSVATENIVKLTLETFKTPKNTEPFIEKSAVNSIAYLINGNHGMDNIIASSVLSVYTTTVDKSVESSEVYLFTYEHNYALVVTFIAGEKKSISINVSPIMLIDIENYKPTSKDSVLKALDYPMFMIEKVD